MNPTIQCPPSQSRYVPFRQQKESKLKLLLQVNENDGVTIVRCTGRITYRNEAAELSRKVVELLQQKPCIVLDLSGIEKIDSAGLGEFVLLHMRAKASNCLFRIAAPRPEIWDLLHLTNLTSLIEVCATVDDAITSFRQRVA